MADDHPPAHPLNNEVDHANLGNDVAVAPRKSIPLPSELLYHILSYLSVLDLTALSRTCHALREHADNGLLWASFVNSNLPQPLSDPTPFDSFKSLYTSQHPFWFIARHRIWFSDVRNTGKLIIARYNAKKALIEAYRVVTPDSFRQFEAWSHDPEVIIHSFNPSVKLWLDDPIIQLDKSACLPETNRVEWQDKEVRMHMASEAQRVFNSLILCSKLAPELQENPEKIVWPPRNIPSADRVDVGYRKNLNVRGLEDKPKRLHEICQFAFRLRRWVTFSNATMFGTGTELNGISTFSTMRPELYTPTRQKPYQGIWVGDYSGHGSEFLLLSQSNIDAETPIPTAADASSASSTPQGRLEAVKLTGDPNVPRGEITFYADDIGPGGLIRVAEEEIFRGARIVHSKGHVASTNFRNGKYFSFFVPRYPFDSTSSFLTVSHFSMQCNKKTKKNTVN